MFCVFLFCFILLLIFDYNRKLLGFEIFVKGMKLLIGVVVLKFLVSV